MSTNAIATYRKVSPTNVALLRDSHSKKRDLVMRQHRAGVPLFLGTDVE